MTSSEYFSPVELVSFGFRSVGSGTRVSRKCSFYGISGSVGDSVRIDDFCILKGHVEIGSHVHISAYCSISGVQGRVKLSDFTTLANRVSIYTGSDDYRADSLSSSTVPEEYLATIRGSVEVGRAALIGAHSVILPGSVIGAAASIGALCLVHGSISAGEVLVSGAVPMIKKGTRNVQRILALADEVIGNTRKTTNGE